MFRTSPLAVALALALLLVGVSCSPDGTIPAPSDDEGRLEADAAPSVRPDARASSLLDAARDVGLEQGAVRVDDAAPTSDGGSDGGGRDAEQGSPDGGGARGSAGCGKRQPAGETMRQLMVEGRARSYLQVVPAAYDPEVPTFLVLGFHGMCGSCRGTTQRNLMGVGVEMLAGGRGVFVYPDGLGGQWIASRDLPFVDALLESLLAEHCIDPSRVFVHGHSNGASFANALACQRGDKL